MSLWILVGILQFSVLFYFCISFSMHCWFALKTFAFSYGKKGFLTLVEHHWVRFAVEVSSELGLYIVGCDRRQMVADECTAGFSRGAGRWCIGAVSGVCLLTCRPCRVDGGDGN
ncbi:hypothetical protein QBC42DRAFT_264533 [Cladorrhinum samala]|uniref:Secreted protein n=1 Tax=Cladorrhinum samala TaxID=585594 RepID=A0AAV9HSP3_9PEZI|nr:hypothetical protein QBC42DRAFT_264533 [Cladorrhinum samala]